ncbi:hypothetical protein R4Z09_28915 [Niallia oryzisoli]|uniref:Uncharacterized protein n=1 Tax=Niallia oryzisoli TaxID=1737571 RepID=A0ABZ2CBQ2_9BACI
MNKNDYTINLTEAEEFGNYIASFLNNYKLIAERNPKKEYLWEVRHPNLVKKQLGAFELCGKKDNIDYYNAGKYIEIRFDKGHLRNLKKYELVDKIKEYRDDSNNFLRFRFYGLIMRV